MATIWCWKLALWATLTVQACGFLAAQQTQFGPFPNRIAQKNRHNSTAFLANRGINTRNYAAMMALARKQDQQIQPNDASSLTSPWAPVGPSAIQISTYGFVSGRVTSVAVDPNDPSGNTVYVGTTGGGVWKSMNAAASLTGSVAFTPLTDTLPASSTCSTPPVPSLSIGAITVQPGGTGVILAGTGDPNDATDSYYGTGVLRSADNGNTWCMISGAVDNIIRKYMFTGEGFAGFAWSGLTPSLVVAAVADSAEGAAVHAPTDNSFAGIYYSTDAGQTWHLAMVGDGQGGDTFQSPQSSIAGNPGNAATSVTWNPIRNRFYAGVRFHGYYESSDGVNWTRMASQPGVNLASSAGKCPANPNLLPSSSCPIFRGTIVSQPVTGDLFAITVDNNNFDQGLWRDVCSATSSGCASSTVAFSQNIADATIENTSNGTIPQGDYDLSLTAVPAGQDTLLFVGTQDLYRCSLLNGCSWRNTTNANGCAAARVAPSQHAIDATFGVNGLMYFGNDGGLWRTTDAVNQQQAACSSDDAVHFQNLNGGLGSIAEVGWFSANPQDATVMIAAMGAFGTAASNGGAWTQVLDGEGDYNAIDPQNPQNWYATSAFPVSINLCTAGTSCNKATFGPVISGANVANDGNGLSSSAAWILDPLDSANVILGTCRVWRGLANGQGWTQSNAISGPLDKDSTNPCVGNAQIRSLAASGGTGTSEMIYAGMAGSVDGGRTVAGHIYSANISNSFGTTSTWTDLTLSPLINSQVGSFNPEGFDVSSIYVDPHDATGNTFYVTLQGFINFGDTGMLVYRTVDGGAHWIAISGNLPDAPANSILVDPNDANTVYVALDTGVYVTRDINLCTDTTNACWSRLGSGLPYAPVTQLRYVNYSSTQVLAASTYGRGIWQIPLVTAGVAATTATLTPPSLTFAAQQKGSISSPQTVTVKNAGTIALNITSVIASQNFSETDNCAQALSPGATCSIQVSFAPELTGTIQGTLTVYGNLPGGQVAAPLSGTGLNPGNIVLQPLSLNFGYAVTGTTTAAQNITISNTGGTNVNLRSPSVTGDFQISANTCGSSLASNFGCTVSVVFKPTTAGGQTGVFSISDDAGTQIAQLAGNGQAKATAVLSMSSLNFTTPVIVGEKSNSLSVVLTNNGDVALSQVAVSVSGDFTVENDCSALLAGHSSCAIPVTFVPTQVGAESGTLQVSTAIGTQTVALSGRGLAPPKVSLLPTSVDFGGQGIHITSAKQHLTLTNNGDVTLTGLAFAATGDFTITDNNCPADGTLAIGGACILGLAFTPQQTGSRTGLLTATASNLLTPFTVPLKGTGEDFQLSVTGPTSAVIVTGQTATYTAQVISVDGSSGGMTLSCSGAPQNATCTVNPASGASLTSGGTLSATITIATGVASTSSFVAPSGWSWRNACLAVTMFFPCVLLGLRKGRNIWRYGLMCLASIFLLSSLACGTHASGGSGSTGGGGTPPGATTPSGIYTLNVTASMDGLEKNVPITLTVQ